MPPEPIAVIQPLVNKSAAEGEKARLECELSSGGSEVVWLKGREPVHPGGRYEIVSEGKKQALVIHGLKAGDQGSYTCMASPEVKTSASLSVDGTVGFPCHFLQLLFTIKYRLENQVELI